jgi:hypothetical protein
MARRYDRLAPLLLAALLAACASPASDASEAEAYGRGCDLGYRDAGRPTNNYFWRDEARYAADPSYRKGWDRGYAACFAQQTRNYKVNGGGGSGH